MSVGRFSTTRRSAGHYAVTDRGRNWEIFKITSRRWIAYEYIGEGDETVAKEVCVERTLRECLSHIKTYGSAPETPKEAPVARSSAPKIYNVELVRSNVPDHIAKAANFASGRRQGNVMIVATSVKAAQERLEQAGWYRPRGVHLNPGGTPGNAIIDAGLLDQEGVIVVWAPNASGENLVLVIDPGESQPRSVGRWEYVDAIDNRAFVRREDGALFPPRFHNEPGTPSTGLEV